MKYIFAILLSILCFTASFAQRDVFKEHFAFSVKHMDDFIDRFNGVPNEQMLDFIEDNYPEIDHEKIDREFLIKTLFNHEDTEILKSKNGQGFLDRVLYNGDLKLNFNDEDWFAVVNCEFSFNDSQQNGRISLRVKYNVSDSSSAWKICAVDLPFIDGRNDANMNFINPVSHATDFIALDRVLDDPDAFTKAISNHAGARDLVKFSRLIDQGSLKLSKRREITYYLFQIPGYVVEVKNFPRSHSNSGYLISKLFVLNDDQKNSLRSSVIFFLEP